MKQRGKLATARSKEEMLALAFKRALTAETLEWIDKILLEYDKMFIDAINDPIGGIEFSRKFILKKTSGIVLCDRFCMGARTDAGMGFFYFGDVTPFMGISHYSKSSENRMLTEILQDMTVVEYIRSKGFEIGIASSKNRDENGQIILYRP